MVAVAMAPWDSEDEVLERIRELTAGLGVEVTVSPGGEPRLPPTPSSSSDSEGFRLLRRAAFRAFPDLIEAVPAVVEGPSDGRAFAAVARDVYRFVPIRMDAGELERTRGANERVRVTAYLGMVRFYAELIREAASASAP